MKKVTLRRCVNVTQKDIISLRSAVRVRWDHVIGMMDEVCSDEEDDDLE